MIRSMIGPKKLFCLLFHCLVVVLCFFRSSLHLCHVRLANFGLAELQYSIVRTTLKPALYMDRLSYAAQEMLTEKHYGTGFNAWHLGVFIHQILSGDMPFETVNRKPSRPICSHISLSILQSTDAFFIVHLCKIAQIQMVLYMLTFSSTLWINCCSSSWKYASHSVNPHTRLTILWTNTISALSPSGRLQRTSAKSWVDNGTKSSISKITPRQLLNFIFYISYFICFIHIAVSNEHDASNYDHCHSQLSRVLTHAFLRRSLHQNIFINFFKMRVLSQHLSLAYSNLARSSCIQRPSANFPGTLIQQTA